MSQDVKLLSPAMRWVLTGRVPCAALAAVMYMALFWGAWLASSAPLLGMLATLAGMTLNLLVPALFAFVTLCGGFRFALHVALIAAALVLMLSGFAWMFAASLLLLYAILPVMVVYLLRMQHDNGMAWAAQFVAAVMFLLVFLAMWLVAGMQETSMEGVSDMMLSPFFDLLTKNASGAELVAISDLKQMSIWMMPGFLAFGLWGVWFSNLVFAQRLSVAYGFVQDVALSLLSLRFGKRFGITALLVLALANVTTGGLQFVTVMLAVLLVGMVSLQGIAVAHQWLKNRGLHMAVVVMYMMVLLWSVVIIPFIIVGFLDIWLDFRQQKEAD